jgi:hypothetical protein
MQHDRRGTTRLPRKLTAAEEGEILQRACMQRAEHHAVDAAWMRATIDDITEGRLPAVPTSSISRFWDRAEWPMRPISGRKAEKWNKFLDLTRTSSKDRSTKL